MACEPLKHCFLDLSQGAFWAIQEEDNESQVTGYHLKYLFLDLTNVEFWACQEAENNFR